MLGFKRRKRSRAYRIAEAAVVFLVALIASTTAAPQLLAFPYSADFGATRVYSERPIPPDMARVLARADALVAQSPLARPGMARTIFLTDGGWRWSLLALNTRRAFALRRPFRDAIIVNASDVAADLVTVPAAIGGTRSLSGVIAHETTHILVSRRYGELRAMMLPAWKSEGYADHVAQASGLSDADYAILRARGENRPSMVYYQARRRVAALLAANGNDVDALMIGR
jgi:hypothetical protein